MTDANRTGGTPRGAINLDNLSFLPLTTASNRNQLDTQIQSVIKRVELPEIMGGKKKSKVRGKGENISELELAERATSPH